MRSQPRIRHQLGRDVTLGEQMRDAQKGLDVIPVTVLRKLQMRYTEPLVLGGFERSPEAIEALRVVSMADQENALLCGGMCHFAWRPNKGGAQITSIDGMSIAANGGKDYRFTFRITFEPTAGGR
jgi:hypothetical protein